MKIQVIVELPKNSKIKIGRSKNPITIRSGEVMFKSRVIKNNDAKSYYSAITNLNELFVKEFAKKLRHSTYEVYIPESQYKITLREIKNAD